jgi:hypothetical protein
MSSMVERRLPLRVKQFAGVGDGHVEGYPPPERIDSLVNGQSRVPRARRNS